MLYVLCTCVCVFMSFVLGRCTVHSGVTCITRSHGRLGPGTSDLGSSHASSPGEPCGERCRADVCARASLVPVRV